MFRRIKRLFGKSTPTVNVIRLEGVIAPGRSLGANLSAKSLEAQISRAFKDKPKAVALAINSPGGSPVQSALIASRIRSLAEEKKIPVLAFCEDVAASGGYWLACAADEIFADENSIIGSIGVISGGFGFPKALAKLGVERRVHTAGLSKSLNDPFRPEKPEDVKKLKLMLADIHLSFTAMVKQRRSGKLNGAESELFSGAYWTGRKALDFGLVDAIGHLHPTLQARFGNTVEINEIAAPRRWSQRLFGSRVRHALATEVIEAGFSALDERALWGRFGL